MTAVEIRAELDALALVVVRLREELGLTQEKVAREDGCSPGTIKNLETSRVDPKLSTLKGVANGLGISLASLLREFATQLDGGVQKARMTSITYPDDETVQVSVREQGLKLQLQVRRSTKRVRKG